MKTVQIYNTKAKVGDIVHFHGARFEIISVWSPREMEGPSPVVVNKARWIDGNTVPGYFGPNQRDWNFQGNFHRQIDIEPRKGESYAQ